MAGTPDTGAYRPAYRVCAVSCLLFRKLLTTCIKIKSDSDAHELGNDKMHKHELITIIGIILLLSFIVNNCHALTKNIYQILSVHINHAPAHRPCTVQERCGQRQRMLIAQPTCPDGAQLGPVRCNGRVVHGFCPRHSPASHAGQPAWFLPGSRIVKIHFWSNPRWRMAHRLDI